MSNTPTTTLFSFTTSRDTQETYSITVERDSPIQSAHHKAKAEAATFSTPQAFQSHLRTNSMEQELGLHISKKQRRSQDKRLSVLREAAQQIDNGQRPGNELGMGKEIGQSVRFQILNGGVQQEQNGRAQAVAPGFIINRQIGQFSRSNESEYQSRQDRGLSFSDSHISSKSKSGSTIESVNGEEDQSDSSSEIGSNQSLLHEDDDDKTSRNDSDQEEQDFAEKIRWLFISPEDEEEDSQINVERPPAGERFASFEHELHTSTNEHSVETVLGKRTKEDEEGIFPQFKNFTLNEKKRDIKFQRKQGGSPMILSRQLDDVTTAPYLTPDLTTTSTTATTKKNQAKASLFEKAQLLANVFNGESLSTGFSICKGKNALKFKCANSHTFFVGVNLLDTLSGKDLDNSRVNAAAISDDFWCYKCKKYYQQCKEVAAQVGVVVVSAPFSSKISLKCSKRGHLFDISYSKKLHTLCCGDCRKLDREEEKERLRQEEQRKNEEYLRKQKELFERARIEMEQQRRQSTDSSSQGSSPSSSSSWSSKQKVSYYQQIEEKINQKARQQAKEYLQEDGALVSQEKAFLVYKFVNTPVDMIIAGMGSMMRDQCVQYFRRLALQLHPDKNQHPLAKEAFQRLQEAQSAVCGAAGSKAC